MRIAPVFNLSQVANVVKFRGNLNSAQSGDVFVKSTENDTNKGIEQTKNIVKDVIIPNLDPQNSPMQDFDPEAYPKGVKNENGEVDTNNSKLNKMLTTFADAVPEYGSTLGRYQHATHQYTLDVHTLKTLKGCIQNPEYPNLSDNDKMVLILSVLLHDIAKPEYQNDREHPAKSSVMAKDIMAKLDFPQEVDNRVVNIIKNHHWYEKYNMGVMTPDEIKEAIGSKEDFRIAKIIADADLRSVNDWFFDEYGQNLPSAIEDMESRFEK